MRRRTFISLAGCAVAAWPMAARAQDRTMRIGVLAGVASTDPQMKARLAAFQRSCVNSVGKMAATYRSITVLLSAARSRRVGRQRTGIAEARSHRGTFDDKRCGVRNMAPTMPVVFVMVSEPVSQGFVKSLANPGGNLTGFSNSEPTMGPKWLELLKEMAPQTKQVSVMFNPDTAPYILPLIETISAVARAICRACQISRSPRSGTNRACDCGSRSRAGGRDDFPGRHIHRGTSPNDFGFRQPTSRACNLRI